MGCLEDFRIYIFFIHSESNRGGATNAISKTSVKKQDTTALYIHHHHHHPHHHHHHIN